MAEFDDKLNAILGNPEIMGQIMSMASSMSQQQASPAPPPQTQSSPGFSMDPAAMQGIMDLMRNTQPDPRQQNLLKALHGFLPDDRLDRLEKAMQASRIARYASRAFAKNKGG